ncbi:glycine-rich protein [Nannocystis sp. SCPEA4]|uniref:glycine-rich protein n=1 Tax=Nannocystis sp. SCPEA4 TaxID=2996787 RepID=UPI00226E6AC7|nr:glycine-rich protein [Nannocystis sp. SCPEA4]MCY1058995.1 glycine-rich protein [Nannocystis sp. SCPEA4]
MAWRMMVVSLAAAGCSDDGTGPATAGPNTTGTTGGATADPATTQPTTSSTTSSTTDATTAEPTTSTVASDPTMGGTTEAVTTTTTETSTTDTAGPSCDAPLSLCAGDCVDTQTDAAHCGGCEHPCLPGELCEAGDCVSECMDGLSECGGSCVDTQTDAAHCGGCDQPCGICQQCSGACVPAAPLAAPGPITGEAMGCTAELGMYSVPSVPGAKWYEWTLPPGTTFWQGAETENVTVKFGTEAGSLCVVAGNECGTSPPTCKQLTMAGAPGSKTFVYTGAEQSFVVPECVTTLSIELWGGQGGAANCCDDVLCCGYNFNDTGGKGGYVKVDYPVAPGDSLFVYVGGQGKQHGVSGWNGGGGGGMWGSGGGGGSDVRIGGQTLEARVLVAAGGGGTSCGQCSGKPTGGDGGGLAGVNGEGGGSGNSGGIGGQQLGGGPAGSPPGQAGSFGQGAGTFNAIHSAGGGGGWYGGGSAGGAGGGGGSSYYHPMAVNPSTTPGVRTGDGQVRISW